jgi:hypothetical protein
VQALEGGLEDPCGGSRDGLAVRPTAQRVVILVVESVVGEEGENGG